MKNLNGGYLAWKIFNPKKLDTGPSIKYSSCTEAASCSTFSAAETSDKTMELDACGLQCPGPIVQVKHKLDAMTNGQKLKVTASDSGFYNDLPAWCESTGNTLVSIEKKGGMVNALIQKGSSHVPATARCGNRHAETNYYRSVQQ